MSDKPEPAIMPLMRPSYGRRNVEHFKEALFL